MDTEQWTDWDTGLFDCFENASTCCYGFWCFPCLACTVSNRFGENYCFPLCDLCSLSITSVFSIPACCVPPALLSLRAAMRHTYKLKGSLCKDVAISCFCVWCSWCQMHRELKFQHKTPTIINMETNIVNMQPAQVMMAPMYQPPPPPPQVAVIRMHR